MSEATIIKIVALPCLSILAAVAVFGFPDAAAKWAFGSVLVIISALLGVPAVVSWARTRRGRR